MNKLFTTLLTVAALSVALPAGLADHCTTYSQADAEITTTGDEGSIHYVDNDFCQPDCGYSLWVYEESNGLPGLQRSQANEGGNPYMTDNTCHGAYPADTGAFY